VPLLIRDVTLADIGGLVTLNNAATPAVPHTSAAEFTELLAASDHAFVIVDADEDAEGRFPRGFVIAMNPGSDYASENYRFFVARSTDFLYVDRIVVAEQSRGQRIGQLLYDRVFELARADGRAEVTCEVNVEPPNPRSLAFHARLGFVEVARQATKGDTVQVALLAAAAEPPV
jgi:predicted GNAT superfamily acetyltransferase